MGYDVVILADNDEVGLKYTTEVADNLIGFAKSVKLVPTQKLYSELQPKGYISDVVFATRPERTVELLNGILKSNEYLHTQKTTPQNNQALDISKNKIQLDDTDNADLFISLFGENVRYNYVRSK